MQHDHPLPPASKARVREWLYLALFVIGTSVPIWVFTQGLKHMPSLQELFSKSVVNPIAAGITADLLISGLVFGVFAIFELKRLKRPMGWLALFFALYCGVGLSSALPCMLWLREKWSP
jgi:hypothetical protein